METEILNLAISQGVFACLFVWLLIYVLKENAKREKHYQQLLHDIADKLTGMVCSVQDDVKEIKNKVFK